MVLSTADPEAISAMRDFELTMNLSWFSEAISARIRRFPVESVGTFIDCGKAQGKL